MLKRYAVRYVVDGGTEIKIARCFLNESQSASDFRQIIAITKLHNAREVDRIEIYSYQHMSLAEALEELHPAGCGFQHRCPTDLHGPIGIPTRDQD